MLRLLHRYPLFFLTLACIISRIPLMLGPDFFLDGDEALMAIMARLTLEGEDFSLYFWGQLYGISFFEVFATIPFYLVLGYTTVAAKLGVFTVWTAGTLFLYKAIQAITKNARMAFGITLLFILFPAWVVWSMKLCGGYASAFLLSNMLIWLLFDEGRRRDVLYYIGIGILLALIFECQRLWLVGTLPFVAYRILQDKKPSAIIYILLSWAFLFTCLYFYKQDIEVTHVSTITRPHRGNIYWYITRFPGYLNSSLQGNYFFNIYQGPWLFNGILAAIGTALFFALFLYGLYCLMRTPKKNLLLIVSVLFIPLTYGYTFLTYIQEGRYLLPVSGFMAIALGVAIKNTPWNTAWKTVYGLLVVCGIGSCIAFYNFFEASKKHKDNVLQTIRFLEDNNVRYTYNTDCMMPFQIMYYSDMKILSRMPFQPARYQPHSNAVDSAMNNGAKIAVIVYRDLLYGMNLDYDLTTEHIRVCIDPPVHEIYKGFDFYHGDKK